MLDKDEIITVPNTPDYIYTNDTDESDVYADLGAAVCNDARGQQADEEYTWTAFINGEEQDDEIIPGKNVDETWEYTDKGAVVEIYIDDYTLDVTVVEINYYLGEVSNCLLYTSAAALPSGINPLLCRQFSAAMDQKIFRGYLTWSGLQVLICYQAVLREPLSNCSRRRFL